MANQEVRRTIRARITNQSAVRADLDSLGFAASKLWNVARWTAGRIWNGLGYLPDNLGVSLQSYLKDHERYADLYSQSSQRVIQELAEAFESWLEQRANGDHRANPPGYRKYGDDHPRSTVTFKQKGFKHDDQYDRVRLSKGANLKDGGRYAHDFVLCEYDVIGPPGTTVENVQQVRTVYEHGEWRLHFVCRVDVDYEDTPGDRTAGIDLGICNFAAVSVGDETLLYPGGALKEDEYWFHKERASCDDPTSRRARRLDQKRTDRRWHFLHAVSKDIVEHCADRGVGTIAVGDVSGIRDDEDGHARNWGDHGNLDLHSWPFETVTKLVEYKAKEQGIDVERVDERGTSKTCTVCGTEADSHRVERGLYVCQACGLVANADCHGAENIRQKVLPNLAPDGGDRDNGCLAQPGVRLFDTSTGQVAPQDQVADSKP
jgi:putative transposase